MLFEKQDRCFVPIFVFGDGTGEYWVRDHPVSAHRVLDDLFRYVAQVDPAEVSPNPFAYTYPQPQGDAPN